jgi:hypothetical protein
MNRAHVMGDMSLTVTADGFVGQVCDWSEGGAALRKRQREAPRPLGG